MTEAPFKKVQQLPACPRNQIAETEALQVTLCVLCGKWRLLIINSICNGNNRFRDIQRSIPGITPRMLSRELKVMETSGLLKRTVTPGTPVMVVYSETDYCLSLAGIILEMIDWGRNQRKLQDK